MTSPGTRLTKRHSRCDTDQTFTQFIGNRPSRQADRRGAEGDCSTVWAGCLGRFRECPEVRGGAAGGAGDRGRGSGLGAGAEGGGRGPGRGPGAGAGEGALDENCLGSTLWRVDCRRECAWTVRTWNRSPDHWPGSQRRWKTGTCGSGAAVP